LNDKDLKSLGKDTLNYNSVSTTVLWKMKCLIDVNQTDFGDEKCFISSTDLCCPGSIVL